MKQRLKQITKFMAVCALLVLSGCEKDLYDDGIQNENRKLIIRDISLKDLTDSKINSKIIERVNDVKNSKNNPNGRIVYDSINDFYFDEEHGKYIEKGNYHSYTFPVYRENGDGKIEKLLFSLKLDGDYDSYLVKYDFTEEEMKNFTASEINQKGIEIKNISNKNGLLSLVCSYGYQFIEIFNTGNGGMTTADPGSHWEVVSTWYSCYPEYGIENVENGGAGTTGPSSSNGGGGGSSSGGTVGGGGSSSSTGTTIVTSPSGTHLTPSEKKFLSFISQLNQQSQDFLNDDENSVIRSNVRAYSVQNNFSSESVSFVNYVITHINEINEIDFPNNIAYSINKPCQKQIVKDVIQVCSPFTELIQQTFDSNDKANIIFSNENGLQGNAITLNEYLGTPQNFTIKIKFDNTFLNNSTDLGIVAVTLHELVHAYLLNLYLKGTLVAANSDYNTLQNAFIAFYNDKVEDTFNTLDNEMHNAMKDFISKMGNSIYNYALLKNISVTADYCEKLAWGTMTGYDLFTQILTPAQQIENNNIYVYEQDNILPEAKGTPCN